MTGLTHLIWRDDSTSKREYTEIRSVRHSFPSSCSRGRGNAARVAIWRVMEESCHMGGPHSLIRGALSWALRGMRSPKHTDKPLSPVGEAREGRGGKSGRGTMGEGALEGGIIRCELVGLKSHWFQQMKNCCSYPTKTPPGGSHTPRGMS